MRNQRDRDDCSNLKKGMVLQISEMHTIDTEIEVKLPGVPFTGGASFKVEKAHFAA